MSTSAAPAVEPAAVADAQALHRLRRWIEHWLADRGIEQWGHGHLSLEGIARQIHAGQWHAVRDPDLGIVAAARLLHRSSHAEWSAIIQRWGSSTS